MFEFLRLTFGLPGGGLWSNLIASGVWAIGGISLGLVHLRRRDARQEQRHQEIRDEMRAHRASIARIHRHLGIDGDD